MSAPPIRWLRPDDPGARAELDPWCSGVGPPLVHRPAPGGAASPSRDEVAIVSWNSGVGAGDLDRLVDDVRSGHLTGRRVPDFVLLLQEVYRSLHASPAPLPGPVVTADRIGRPAPARAREEIATAARRHGLHLFYVPSMGNGRPDDPGPAEDRGNAILSTLPLEGLQAIELPLQAQRRVAVSAVVRGDGSDGAPWSVRVVSVHLDHRARFGRILWSFGEGRARHAELVTGAMDGQGPVVVGGDLNTWFGGARESAVEIMRAHFPLPEDPPEPGTMHTPLFFDPVVDHLFFRVPPEWRPGYRVLESGYGSDHRPLFGWIRPGVRSAEQEEEDDLS
ncbi:MAG: hypothetical protein GWM92_10080 [Gemmatimonadetes bacterium]|nr:hypothetical protein [Gemmatimonadota bacterium]NIR79022.1 hypothetical protein [Gemmatimonadota bacterium]NIT87669.1 hypothetical protein [Gemmatimonadota bacterium]NIU31540.1 hypothetical protein [Gemmatimonadota bacterium]NIU36192.1 hypothetical protein [Gemmatimonadota bacterium]